MIAEFLTDAAKRGLVVTFDGCRNKLFASPPAMLTEADTVFIKANREAIVDAIIKATPVAAANHPPTCRGVCPGPMSNLCAGCPQEEYRSADGLIYSAWCVAGRDVGKPVEVRERSQSKWREIGQQQEGRVA